MKKLLFLFSLSLVLFSCKVTWVPAKSPSMIVNVLDVQSSTSSLYDAMIASPDKSFTTYATDYSNIERKIDSIVAMNQVRDHGTNIYTQATLLQKYFVKYEADHRNKGTLTSGQLRVYRDYLKSFIKPILVSELSLK